MNYFEFNQKCFEKECLRRTMITKNCVREFKQKSCYRKWLKKVEKIELSHSEFVKDERWEECKIAIHQRDKTCRIYALLTLNDHEIISLKYKESFQFLSKQLDVAHIYPRLQRPDLYYELTNLVLVNRYFHTLLDQYQHPVNRTKISVEERLNWLKSARDKKRKVV